MFFASGAVSSANDYSQKTIFLYLFLIVIVSGAFIYNIFRPTTESEYGVLLMGMDAKNYIHALFIYNAINILIGYTAFGIPAALLAGVPWYLALLIPIAGIGFKAFTLGIQMASYAAKQSIGRRYTKKGIPISFEGNFNVRILIFCLLITAGPIATIAIAYYDLYIINAALVIASAALVLPGMILIKVFPYGLYRTAVSAEQKRSEITKKDYKEKQNKGNRVNINKIDHPITLTESKEKRSHGFRYLNDLFIKRHSNIFVGRLIGTIIGTAASIAILSVFLYYEIKGFGDDISSSVLRYLFSRHSGIFMLIMFFINSGAYMAHAMFANCDSSMLMYGFYKKPDALIKMYRLRFGSIVRYNIIPAIMASVFAVVVMTITGGEDYTGQYISTVLCILASMVFFSIRHLTLYYLIQPYASDFRVKSRLYTFLSFFIFTVCLALMIAPVPAYIITGFALAMIFLYTFLGSRLIYRFGPRSFRIK